MNIVNLQDIKSTHRNPLHSYTLTMRMEKEMAIHSSILAWRIPRTEGPGGLQSMGLQESWAQHSD